MTRKNILAIAFAAVALFGFGIKSSGQTGAYGDYTPYSLFGLGEIAPPGNAYNRGMGGVGIATRNNRYMNLLNPAAVTARDTLSFMADMGVFQSNYMFRQGNLKSAENLFNIQDLALSFPIYRSSAMMIGLVPYSNTGYDFSYPIQDEQFLARTGSASYLSSGQGNIYNVFVAGGVTFFKKISIGAQANYYFGKIERGNYLTYQNAAYSGVIGGSSYTLNGFSGKFGLQFEQKVGDLTLGVGATYSLKTNLGGYRENYKYYSNTSVATTPFKDDVDTLGFSVRDGKLVEKVVLAPEMGVGISINGGNRWRAEINYVRSDWRGNSLENIPGFSVKGINNFTLTCSQSIRAGFEIVPNINDIRYYYRKCAYRAGFHYDKAYYLVNGMPINGFGITLGATLPVFRFYNGISLAVDFGQRGRNADSLVRERYVNFSVAFNIHDLWFMKHQYQ